VSDTPANVDDDRPVLLTVEVTAATTELVADALWEHGSTGMEERADRIIAGFPNHAGAAAAAAALVDREIAGPGSIVDVNDDTWLDGWKAYARAHRAGQRIVLQPTWLDPAPVGEGDLVVHLDPGRAFGSGAHATTRLVLARLEAIVEPATTTVLDLGCGSGVLTVAAALLGAADVVAVDLDPAALRATADNAARNGVACTIHGDLAAVDGRRFDVVAANIGANTLIDLEPALRPHDVVILAGFLAFREAEVRAAFADRPLLHRDAEDDWVCLTLGGCAVGPAV